MSSVTNILHLQEVGADLRVRGWLQESETDILGNIGALKIQRWWKGALRDPVTLQATALTGAVLIPLNKRSGASSTVHVEVDEFASGSDVVPALADALSVCSDETTPFEFDEDERPSISASARIAGQCDSL